MSQDSRAFKDSVYAQFSRIGKAVSSPKRLEILDLLSQSSKTVEKIAQATEMSVANTSQHLQVLLEASLVEFRKKGLYSYYQIADDSVSNFIISLQLLAEKRIAEIQRLRNEFYANREQLEQIKIDELLKRMKLGSVTLIDVRPREEYETMHIPGAISMPIGELERHWSSLPPSHEIVAYCRGRYCILSVEAVELLGAHGIHAFRLEENVQEWNAHCAESPLQ